MRCPSHCPPESGGVAVKALGVLAAVAVAVPVLAVAGSVAVAVIAAEVAAAGVIVAALLRRLRPARRLVPATMRDPVPQRALTRGQAAIEGPRSLPGVTVRLDASSYERIDR